MEGFAAAAQLLKRAGDNGFLIEYICLAAAVVDGTLRIGLVLQHQIRTKSVEAPEALLYQRATDPIISERAIFRRAQAEGVIGQGLASHLENLYTKRNQVIHRYIISEITTQEVFEIAGEFGQVIPLVSQAVWEIEERQIQMGVGMTKRGEDQTGLREINELSSKKHGDKGLAQRLGRQMT